MGEPNLSVSIDDRMLVSLYDALTDQPNVLTEGRVEAANQLIREERSVYTTAEREYAATHGIFQSGVPTSFTRPMAHQILLGTLCHRLEAMGYTVESVNSSGFGYQFQLSINGRAVSATLYPAESGNSGDAGSNFLTRLQFTAEVLQSPASAPVTSVSLESQTTSVSFRIADGGTLFLDNHYLSPTAFQNGYRAYRALGTLAGDGESSPGHPVFTGSVAVDQEGILSASYAYPGHGDMPHVVLGNAAHLGDNEAIRARFTAKVGARIRE